jgi:hypothetical protein
MSAPAAGPYPGLNPYDETDASFFFGRESERRIVVANMMSQPLTLLYGPSGVGKSSLLAAGVRYELRERARRTAEVADSPELAVVYFRRWQDPVAEALREAVIVATVEAVGSHPDEPPTGFLATLRWAADTVGGTVFVILDQFEEYFHYWPDVAGDEGFAADFPRAVRGSVGRFSFLLSVREDGLSQLDRFQKRIPGLFDNRLRLDDLDGDSARSAIANPLKAHDQLGGSGPATIEPELVEEILLQATSSGRQIGRAVEPAMKSLDVRVNAPLLQVVLDRLWREELTRGSATLRVNTLLELGGAEGILRTHADQAMRTLPAGDRGLAAEAFHFLVTVSGVRVALTAADLADYVGCSREEVMVLLKHLTAGGVRLLHAVPGPGYEPRYEVPHDLVASAVADWRARHALGSTVELAQERRQVHQLGLAVVVLAVLVVGLIAALATILVLFR